MNVKQHSTPAKSGMQQTRDSIHRSWSREERRKRQRIAAARQQWLFSVLATQRSAVPARVA